MGKRWRVKIGLLCMVCALFVGSVASPASATSFKASGYPALAKGEQKSASFKTEGGTVECKKFNFEADLAPGGAEELEAFPTFSECSAFGFVSATVTATGCAFRGKAAVSKIELSCEAESKVVITASTCEIQMTPGAEVPEGTTYTNVTGPPKTVEVKVALTGVPYTVTKDGFLCPFGGTGSKTNGEISVTSLVKGFKGESQVDLFTE